jgi:hypothetical protein
VENELVRQPARIKRRSCHCESNREDYAHGATLSYEIDDHWSVGTAIDYVSVRFDPQGTLGILSGGNLSGYTGYLWLKWQL